MRNLDTLTLFKELGCLFIFKQPIIILGGQKMENVFKKIILGVMAIIMVFALVACKSSDESTYEKIQSKGQLTFAMTGAYPPFNFVNEDGEVVGFDIDIANALAKEMELEAVPITTAWDGILGGLTSKRFDTIIGSMAITEKRLERVNFTSPYYYDGAQFFVPNSSTLSNLDDLEEGKVGVVTGTTFHDMLKDKENVSEIMQFESDVDNFMALEQGRMDGLVTGKFVGILAPEKYGVKIKSAGDLLYSEEIGIAVRQDDDQLLKELNKALKTIVENGSYEKISNKWFGENILER